MLNRLLPSLTASLVQSHISIGLEQAKPSFTQPKGMDFNESTAVSEMIENEGFTEAGQGNASVATFHEIGSISALGPEFISGISRVDLLTRETVPPSPPSEISRLIEAFNNNLLDHEAPIAFIDSEEGFEISAAAAQESLNMRL